MNVPESRFIPSYPLRFSSSVLSGLPCAPVTPPANALTSDSTFPCCTADLYPASSRSMPRVCTTAEEEATRERYDAGSNADAACHSTLSTHFGVWPAGVTYGRPDELMVSTLPRRDREDPPHARDLPSFRDGRFADCRTWPCQLQSATVGGSDAPRKPFPPTTSSFGTDILSVPL